MRRKYFWLLLFVLIIATFLRLYQLQSIPPGLYPDEAMNGNNASEAIATGHYKIFYPENNGREGLFINIQAFFLKIIGIHEGWVLRFPSAIFGILTVLAMYFLGKELFSKEVGLLAAFFLATNFWHINFSRIGFRAIMSPFFMASSLALLVYSLKNAGSKARRERSAAVFGGLLFGLGFYSYIAYRVAPLLAAFVISYFYFNKKDARKNVLLLGSYFLIFAFFAALPIGMYFLKNPHDFMGRTSQVSVFSSENPAKDLALNFAKTMGMFNIAGDYNWRHNYSGAPELFWPVGILFLIGFADSIYLSLKKRDFPNMVLLVSFFLFFLPVIISNEGIPHALRSILLIPSVMIFSALGGVKLYEYSKRFIHSPWRGFAIFLFLLAVLFQGYYQYFVAWYKNLNTQGAFAANYVELGHILNSLPDSTPKYILVKAGGTDVRGLPMPTQTVMFITDTFLPENQIKKNFHYILPQNENSIPYGALKFVIE